MNEQEFFTELNKYPMLVGESSQHNQQQQQQPQQNIFSMLSSAFGSLNNSRSPATHKRDLNQATFRQSTNHI
ncbi:hypothetical protein PPL_03703 [Heterostelium album PN500]|uniref:Uncharacterized protein n=1 Tax=Heterostelium pallidum (strain ATCC 26659 / Pp 5 / PN500) TaxID=670386 RepID=D3B6F5_HETP5|nr:hypothetical protein PPL_03703 [Heterostelium album PN500]EFA82925.1 hypothetical protein PPL_03703 [Heterostelium album PN500]|eukprot:XP_020435042.1 hypothetical protein PPL_03703 [Heterostelium album PN500]